MADRAQIGDLLQILHSLWPHSSPIPKGLDDKRFATEVAKLVGPWHAVLGDLPTDALGLAVKSLAASGREFFPPAGVVRQHAFELMEPDAYKMTAGEAWDEVNRAVRQGEHRFRNGMVRWSSPTVEAAFRSIGGWAYFKFALEDSYMADRARFCDAFNQLQKREQGTRRELPAVAEYRQLVGETVRRLTDKSRTQPPPAADKPYTD